MTWTLKHPTEGTEREFPSRSAAEEERGELEELMGVELELIPPEEKASDGGTQPVEAEPVDVPDSKPSLEQDPVEWMPSHFIDTIQGVPTVNRKGYCVIASKFGVSVEAEPVVRASETDFEYAEFQALAETQEGRTYSGFGSAHVDRQDGDDPYLLNELAETRALKRAVAWATGIGMTAVSEMQGDRA